MSFSWDYVILLNNFFWQLKNVKTTHSIQKKKKRWGAGFGPQAMIWCIQLHVPPVSWCIYLQTGSMLYVMFCMEIFLLRFPGGHSLSVLGLLPFDWSCDIQAHAMMKSFYLFFYLFFTSKAAVDLLVHWRTSVILSIELIHRGVIRTNNSA